MIWLHLLIIVSCQSTEHIIPPRRDAILNTDGSDQGCLRALLRFEWDNSRYARSLQPRRLDVGSGPLLKSYDARLCTVDEACDATFQCRVLRGHLFYPFQLIYINFHGWFKIMCAAQWPHVLIEGKGKDAIARCLTNEEVEVMRREEKFREGVLRLNFGRTMSMDADRLFRLLRATHGHSMSDRSP